MHNILQLEQKYAGFVGSRHCVAVSSGTAALHLSLLATGIKPGDEVIVPDFTMAAIGFAVSYVGAKVVTVDCRSDYNIDPNLIEEKINEKTKAIIAVHTYGRLCDMQAIGEISKKHKLKIIEDGCEAQGAATGGHSDCLVFSFYKNKIIHAEEGGIICTDSPIIANDARDLKNMAFGTKHDYFHDRIGFNYRMPDSQAKMALKSLAKYEQNNRLRREWEKEWNLLAKTKRKRDAVWVYDILSRTGYEKKRHIEELNEKKISWRHFFKPLSTMPMWKQTIGGHALDYANRGLYIQYHE